MKKLFLHIGPPKTGTSTLQDFLYHNRDNLRNFGYLYPQTGIKSMKFPAQHNLAQLIIKSKLAKPNGGTWKEFYSEIENANFENIIISSEFFSLANKKQTEILKSELKFHEVTIIIYLRRQDLRLESSYTEAVKKGRCAIDILSFVEKRRNESDYYKLLERWKQAFGIDNLIVRPLEKAQIPNICHDILKTVGIDDYKSFSEIDNTNIRPARKALEVLKLANKVYKNLPKKLREKSIRKIKDYLQENWTEEGKYRLIPYSESVKILQEYKESNQAVAREYLGREDGVLFYEPLEYYEIDNSYIEDLSKEELLSLILALSVD